MYQFRVGALRKKKEDGSKLSRKLTVIHRKQKRFLITRPHATVTLEVPADGTRKRPVTGCSHSRRLPVMLLLTLLALQLPCASTLTYTMAVLVPLTGPRRMGLIEVEAALNVTLTKLELDPSLAKLMRSGHTFAFMINDTRCDRGTGLYEFVEMVTHQMRNASNAIHAVIGPSCDNVCESVGLLASRWRIPVISFGCWSDELTNREDYGTLVRTTGSFNEIGVFFMSIMQVYRWKRVTLVTGLQAAWMKAVASLTLEFMNVGMVVRRMVLETSKLNELLPNEAKQTRVFVLCAYGQDIIHFMLAAHRNGLMNGEYAFVALDYANMAKRIPDSYNSSIPFGEVFGGRLNLE
ncbi:atrial natriuretic peptide receptor 3-like [Gigantopelta aegis]|uniref:atrial natriuretic peptide receptor 3-like n=1 Tax=Gigantopelta aegis TaxID=1735272 RepID=UPI001B88D920|nr:atrial natriuretic peptide receptor 3-like [Gigantopelta aegis]